MIEVSLQRRFGAFVLDAAFTAPSDGVTAITGPSGSGKTTLLRCIAGLERTTGEVTVNGDVWQDKRTFTPPHRRGVGYVFQDAALFTHLSLRANLRYGLDRAGPRPGLAFDDVVSLLNLAALLPRSASKLSGGERQRGAIARALLSRPRLLLMDEPTASLDADARRELLPYLDRLHRELKLPILYVSHDALEVDRLADRVFRMEAGRIAPVGVAGGTAATDAALGSLSEAEVRRLAAAAIRAGLG